MTSAVGACFHPVPALGVFRDASGVNAAVCFNEGVMKLETCICGSPSAQNCPFLIRSSPKLNKLATIFLRRTRSEGVGVQGS